MAKEYKNWDKEYIAVYSIYRPHTPEGMKQKDIMLLTNKEEYLSKWCEKIEQHHRFSARDDEHASDIALVHQTGLENIKGIAVVIMEDLLSVNSIKKELNLENETGK